MHIHLIKTDKMFCVWSFQNISFPDELFNQLINQPIKRYYSALKNWWVASLVYRTWPCTKS